jgi:RNA polymerase sigma-70 factor (ECF subfamily)
VLPEKLTDLLLSVAEGRSTAEDPRVERAAARLVAARRAFPAIDLRLSDFARHVGTALASSGTGDPIDLLDALHWEDLYLALGCAAGHPAAMAAFEQRFMPAVAGYVAKIDPSPQFADEVRQLVRQRLFVADGELPPKIAGYTGRGPLGGWLRVACIRTAQNVQRSTRSYADLDETPFAARADGPDPEVDYLKARYGAELREAFESALRELSPRDRVMLSLHFVDGLSTAAVAALQGVHEATVRRWLERARQTILEDTRQRLRRRLGASSAEVDSLIDLAQSRLDFTLRACLGGEPSTGT